MTNKSVIADGVAAEMDSLMSSEDYKKLFARPRVKTAQALEVADVADCKDEPKKECKKDQGPCDCADCLDAKKSEEKKEEEKSASLVEQLVSISETLDKIGLEKTSSLTLSLVDVLIAEAAKKAPKKDKKDEKKEEKKDKKDKKEDKKEDKKDKKFPFFMKKKNEDKK
jgi:hypothetical protein